MTDFYDELAPYFHLIFQDWEASVARQGNQLTALLAARWPGCRTVLDVSCGIGTQAIGLAQNGFVVTASDLAAGAVARARTEARTRGLQISFAVGDMRSCFTQHGGGFDLVLSGDNSVPHLLTDADIVLAFRQMLACLRPGGGCVVTVRDYDREPHGTGIVKPYGVRVENGFRYVALQVWDFTGEQYDFTLFLIEENLSTGAVQTRAMQSRYYAIGTDKLLALMREAGFVDVERLDGVFYQPVLVGTKPGL
ncbi:MAG: class I SAM-dependent methyltransferase [Blastocatellia bacterium]|nr:class I SAM-dependent methyltransferase [Blastocatellia bacterium]